MAKLQSDRYERGHFRKIWLEYYCLGENCGSGTLSLKFIRCQKYLLGAQNTIWVKFLEFIIFLPEKARYITRRYIRYHQNKNQLGVTSSSYVNLTIKLLIKSDLLA